MADGPKNIPQDIGGSQFGEMAPIDNIVDDKEETTIEGTPLNAGSNTAGYTY